MIVDASLNALVAVTRWSAALPGAMPTVGAPSPWVVLMWPALFLPLSDAKDIALRVVAGGLLLALW